MQKAKSEIKIVVLDLTRQLLANVRSKRSLVGWVLGLESKSPDPFLMGFLYDLKSSSLEYRLFFLRIPCFPLS